MIDVLQFYYLHLLSKSLKSVEKSFIGSHSLYFSIFIG